jgi:hypothetical protein
MYLHSYLAAEPHASLAWANSATEAVRTDSLVAPIGCGATWSMTLRAGGKGMDGTSYVDYFT